MNQSELSGQQFLDLLRSQEHGGFLIDAEESLLNLIEAVQRTGKKGALKLTLTVVSDKNALDEAAVFISGAIAASTPEPDRRHTLFYHVDGRLSRRDPRQPELPAFAAIPTSQPVDETTGEIRSAQ